MRQMRSKKECARIAGVCEATINNRIARGIAPSLRAVSLGIDDVPAPRPEAPGAASSGRMGDDFPEMLEAPSR
jgi:hypothetical protein